MGSLRSTRNELQTGHPLQPGKLGGGSMSSALGLWHSAYSPKGQPQMPLTQGAVETQTAPQLPQFCEQGQQAGIVNC